MQIFYKLSKKNMRRFDTHMAGDNPGLGVCGQRDDSVSGLSQDRARLFTTQDPLRNQEKKTRQFNIGTAFQILCGCEATCAASSLLSYCSYSLNVCGKEYDLHAFVYYSLY